MNGIKEFLSGSYNTLLVSTTGRPSNDITRLPDKEISGEFVANFLINDDEVARDLFMRVEGKIKTVLIDVEKKQCIDLMKIAKEIFGKEVIKAYKPNDITLEAIDQLIMNRLKMDLRGKNIQVYGTGNLSFKIALRLLEREANITIAGRDEKKVASIVETLNIIKPRFSNAIIQSKFADTPADTYDGLISFLSSEKVIDDSIVKSIKKGGFAIDGGIGNFQGEFIAKALEKEISVLRLDVRIGNPFLEASIQSLSEDNPFFTKVMGAKQLGNVKLVAGGIIGEAGSIIVDQIENPSQIIGVANGYGGLKNEEQFTNDDRKNLQYAKETIVQTI